MKACKEAFRCLVGFAIIVLVLYFMDIGCIFRFLTGVPCPGCGLTRAYISLLNFDISVALYYHPLFWLIPPVFIVAFFCKSPLFGSKRIETILLLFVGALFVGVFIYRLLFDNNSIIKIDISNGIVVKLLKNIAEVMQ